MTIPQSASQDVLSLARHSQASLKTHLATASKVTTEALVFKLVILRAPFASATPISTFHSAMSRSHAVFYHGCDETTSSPNWLSCWRYSTLVLLFQRSSHVESKWMPICGLKIIESSGNKAGSCGREHDEALLCPYCDAISYIQYIDTTGYTQPRELQSRLTKGILTGYYQFLMDRIKAHANTASQWLAWYATGHENQTEHATHESLSCTCDSLLWSGSHRNPHKRPLQGSGVSTWWSNWIASLSIDRNQVWRYAPGSEDGPRHEFTTRNTTLPDVILGLPFDLNDRALACIPLFPDDPITRHLEALEVAVPLTMPTSVPASLKHGSKKKTKAGLTVRELMASLTFRSEYRNGTGTHFYMKLKSPGKMGSVADPDTKNQIEPVSEPVSKLETAWSLDDWITSTFRCLDFGSLEAAQKSTLRLLDEIDKLQRKEASKDSLLVQDFDFSELYHDIQMNAIKVGPKNRLEQDSLPFSTNNIQGLVKRRKT